MEFKTKNTNNDYEIVRILLELPPSLILRLGKVKTCCYHHLMPNMYIYMYRKYETMEDKSDEALRKHITRFYKKIMPSSEYHEYAQDAYTSLKSLIDKGQELYKEEMEYGETKKQCKA